MPSKTKLADKFRFARSQNECLKIDVKVLTDELRLVSEKHERAMKGWGESQRHAKNLERHLDEAQRTPTTWVEVVDAEGTILRSGVAAEITHTVEKPEHTSIWEPFASILPARHTYRVRFAGHVEPYTFCTSDGGQLIVRPAVIP